VGRNDRARRPGLADDLVATGQLEQADADRFVAAVHHAAQAGNFSMWLTMFSVIATPVEHQRG